MVVSKYCYLFVNLKGNFAGYHILVLQFHFRARDPLFHAFLSLKVPMKGMRSFWYLCLCMSRCFFCSTLCIVSVTSWWLYVIWKFPGKVYSKLKCFLCLHTDFCLWAWELFCYNFTEVHVLLSLICPLSIKFILLHYLAYWWCFLMWLFIW